MKMSTRNIMAIVWAMALLAAPFAQASTLYWDGGTADAGDPGNGLSAGGAGTWDTTLKNWDAGAVPHVAWVNGNNDIAVFGGTAGTVTLGEAISVGGLLFNTTGYTINNSTYTLTFGATDNTILLNNVGAATITGQLGGSGNVALTAANPATAGTVTFNGISTGGWSGTTTVNPGIRLEMTGNVNNQALLNTSAINLYGGTIAMGGAAAIGTRINRINDSAPIYSYGGTIEWNVNQSGITVETNGTVNLIRGQFNFFEGFSLVGGTTMQIYTLSGLSRMGASNTSVINLQAKNNAFSTSGGGQQMIVGGIGANTPSGQIVGPWFTTLYSNYTAADYIIYSNGGSGSTYYAVPAAATLAAPGQSGWSSSTTAYQFGAAETLTANRIAAALRYTGAAATLNLGSSYSLETSGLLNGGSGTLTITNGVLTTPTGGGAGTTNSLFLTPLANAITIAGGSTAINDNGAAVTLVKSGNNTLTLNSTTSTYSGGTVLNAGTLVTTTNANLGSGGGITVNGAVTWNMGAAVSVTYNRTLSVNDGAVLTLTTGFGAKTITGILSGSGAIITSVTTDYIFSNTGNTFNGPVTSSTGITSSYGLGFNSIGDDAGAGLINLNNGSFRWLKASGGTTVLGNRQFALSGTTSGGQITALGSSSSENLVINKNLLITGIGNKALTLGGPNTGNNTFAGNIADGPSSVISLTKADAGKWILSGTNTYSGATTVTAGKLVGVVGGSCSNSAVAVSAGTLGISVTDTTQQWACVGLTYTAASALEFDFGGNTLSTTVAPLQVNGNVVFAVAPTVICANTSLSAGTYPLVTWTGTFSGVAPSSPVLPSGVTGLLVVDNATKTLWLSISASGSSKQPLTWKGPAGSSWVINEAVYTKWQDATTPTPVSTNYQETTVSGITVGDNVVFGTTGAGSVTLDTIVSPASVSVNTTANYTFSGTGSIAGPGGLTKANSGTLTLSTANSYSGGTSLGAGTLSMGINDALGIGPVVLSSGTIQSSDATARTLNNPVVLNGNTTVGGTGNLSFTSPGAGSVAVASTLTVNGSLNATFATALSGSGALTKAGTGTMTLTGTNTYSGATTVSAGTLVFSGGQMTNNAAVSVTGTMVITNGVQVFTGGGNHIIGTANGSVKVYGGSGGPSLWNLGNQSLYFGPVNNTGGNNNNLVIDGDGVAGGAIVTNVNNVIIGRSTANSSITLANGAQMFVNGQVQIGNVYYGGLVGTNNSIRIMGGTSDSLFYGSANSFYVGFGERAGATYNQVYVGTGGVLSNVGYNAANRNLDFVVGHVQDLQNGAYIAYSNQLVVADGGKAFLLGNLAVGYSSAAREANSNAVLIANGGLVNVPGALSIGYANVVNATNNSNSVTISNGGQFFTGADSMIGRAAVTGAGTVANNNTAWVNGANSLWNLGNKNLFVGSATGTGQAIGNVLSVTAGGMATNISALIVSANNTLSLGAGGQIYAGAATIPGTMAVGLDKNATPVSGNLAVAGSLNVSSATLDVSLTGTPTGTYVIASYDSLTGSFAATNGLPATYKLEMDYKGQKQIAIVYSATGTVISFQ